MRVWIVWTRRLLFKAIVKPDAEMAGYIPPSLAAATSTRIDSGCKHIQQCRVSQDHMLKFAENNGEDMLTNKYGYAVHKDEPVLAIGDSWYEKDKIHGQAAYPRVTSNLGRMGDRTSNEHNPRSPALRFMLWVYHNVGNIEERQRIIHAANMPTSHLFCHGTHAGALQGDAADEAFFGFTDANHPFAFQRPEELGRIYDFVMTGYANTVGFAHAHHGDTMTSVHIGGLRTVMNGDFPVRCGDKLQWYWPDEAKLFTAQGARLPRTVDDDGALVLRNPFAHGGFRPPTKGGEAERERMQNLQYGQKGGMTKYIPRVKPFVDDHDSPRLYDHFRVFAVAISSARPHEIFDIMIGRQAI